MWIARYPSRCRLWLCQRSWRRRDRRPRTGGGAAHFFFGGSLAYRLFLHQISPKVVGPRLRISHQGVRCPPGPQGLWRVNKRMCRSPALSRSQLGGITMSTFYRVPSPVSPDTTWVGVNIVVIPVFIPHSLHPKFSRVLAPHASLYVHTVIPPSHCATDIVNFLDPAWCLCFVAQSFWAHSDTETLGQHVGEFPRRSAAIPGFHPPSHGPGHLEWLPSTWRRRVHIPCPALSRHQS
jgi:hypothetical protein